MIKSKNNSGLTLPELLISLGIYLYAQNFLIENIAPVSNIGALN